MKSRLYPRHLLAFSIWAVWFSRFLACTALTFPGKSSTDILSSSPINLDTQYGFLYPAARSAANKEFRIKDEGCSTPADAPRELPLIIPGIVAR